MITKEEEEYHTSKAGTIESRDNILLDNDIIVNPKMKKNHRMDRKEQRLQVR